MSDKQTVAEANVRADSYFIVRTKARCWHCGTNTRLVALGVPKHHETLVDLSAEDRAEGTPLKYWEQADATALLFYVEDLPDAVREQLQEISQCFRKGYSVATLNSYWANHCGFCRTLLDDHDLHCELDSAFVTSGESGAAQIEVLHIKKPFEVSAAGSSLDPELFDCDLSG